MESKYFFIFLLLSVLCINFVFASQTKMTVKECIYSFNEELDTVTGFPPFAPWDEVNQKGVFMKFENSNLNLGPTQNPVYSYTFYQNGGAPRQYYNNFFVDATRTTRFPILNVREGNSNMVYVRCEYVVGQYNVDFVNFRPFYFWALFSSQDFNVTVGEFTGTQSWRSYVTPPYSESNYYTYDQVYDNGNGGDIFYYDTGVSVGYSESALLNDGFDPYSTPVVYVAKNLTAKLPGLIYGFDLIRENGNTDLYGPRPYAFMYLNSSIKGPVAHPVFQSIDYILYDDTGSVVYRGMNLPSIGCEIGDNCPYVGEGYKVVSNITYKNIKSYPLDDIRIYFRYQESATYGTNYPQPGRPILMDYFVPRTGLHFEPAGTPGDTQTVTYERDLTGYSSFQRLLGAVWAWNDNKIGESHYLRIGSECTTYLGFKSLDPYLVLKRGPTGVFPAFQIDTELYVIDNVANATYCSPNRVYPDDYSLELDLNLDGYTGVTNDTIAIPLDLSTFVDANGLNIPSCPGPNCYLASGDHDYVLPIVIPITQNYIDNLRSHTVYPVVYSLKESDPYNQVRIGRTESRISFEPGAIGILDKAMLFHRLKRDDIIDYWLWNANDNYLTVEFETRRFSDPENFTIELPASTVLYPYEEAHKFLIKGTATHNPWPVISTSKSEWFELVVRTSTSPFDVNETVYNVSLDMFNTFVQFNAIPENPVAGVVNFQDPNVLEERNISLKWYFNGGADELAFVDGASYFVNYSFYHENGTLLLSDSQEFFVDQNRPWDSLYFMYAFNASANYNVTFIIDSEQNLDEDDEFDNYVFFEIKTSIDSCRYDQATNSIYIYDFATQMLELDSECHGRCCPFGYICVAGGECAQSISYLCPTYNRNQAACEDYDQTRPAICLFADEEADICKACGEVPKTCGTYDNDISCGTDNCNFHQIDEAILNTTGGCLWTGSFCAFQSLDCNYRIEEEGDCSTRHYLNYTSENPALCPWHIVDIQCPETVGVPFFSITNVIVVLIGLLIFYIVFRKEDS